LTTLEINEKYYYEIATVYGYSRPEKIGKIRKKSGFL
jgi:hypothetical protein